MEITGNDSKRLKITKSAVNGMDDEVVKQLECPICFEILAGLQIYQCKKGHHLCAVCKKKLSKCPTCKAVIGKTRAIGMEAIAAAFEFNCKNVLCSLIFKGCELNQHLKVCEHRPFRCVERSGTKECFGVLVDSTQFQAHLKTVHKVKQRPLAHYVSMSIANFYDYLQWNIFYFDFDGQMFVVNHTLEKKHLYIWMSLIGTETKAKQYRYTVTIPALTCGNHFPKRADIKKINTIEWNLSVHSYHQRFEDLKTTMDILCFSTDQLKKYCVEGIENENMVFRFASLFELFKKIDILV